MSGGLTYPRIAMGAPSYGHKRLRAKWPPRDALDPQYAVRNQCCHRSANAPASDDYPESMKALVKGCGLSARECIYQGTWGPLSHPYNQIWRWERGFPAWDAPYTPPPFYQEWRVSPHTLNDDWVWDFEENNYPNVQEPPAGGVSGTWYAVAHAHTGPLRGDTEDRPMTQSCIGEDITPRRRANRVLVFENVHRDSTGAYVNLDAAHLTYLLRPAPPSVTNSPHYEPWGIHPKLTVGTHAQFKRAAGGPGTFCGYYATRFKDGTAYTVVSPPALRDFTPASVTNAPVTDWQHIESNLSGLCVSNSIARFFPGRKADFLATVPSGLPHTVLVLCDVIMYTLRSRPTTGDTWTGASSLVFYHLRGAASAFL